MTSRTVSCPTCKWGQWAEAEPLCPKCKRFSRWQPIPERKVRWSRREGHIPSYIRHKKTEEKDGR